MTSLSAREKRHQRTRQDILDAARQIINREGPENLSMRRLAQRIDYSPAGLYEYFDSKEAIILAVCEQGHERLANYLQAVNTELVPADYLLELGLAYIRFAIENPDFYLLMFTIRPPKDSTTERLEDQATYAILLVAVERGITAGVFKTAVNYGQAEIAYAAWSLVHGIAMLRITVLQDYPLDFEVLDRQALGTLFYGLAR